MANQYIVFLLNDEMYGLQINFVKEIIKYQPVTELPTQSKDTKGIINYRNHILPIVNLKSKFELSNTEFNYNDNTRIVIIFDEDDEGKMMGVLTDHVEKIVVIEDKDLDKLEGIVENSFITYVGKSENNLISLIDSNKLFSTEQ